MDRNLDSIHCHWVLYKNHNAIFYNAAVNVIHGLIHLHLDIKTWQIKCASKTNIAYLKRKQVSTLLFCHFENGRVGQHTSVMRAARPAYIYICKASSRDMALKYGHIKNVSNFSNDHNSLGTTFLPEIVVHNSLKYNWMPSLTIVVSCCIFLGSNYRDVATFYGTSTQRIPMFSEPI